MSSSAEDSFERREVDRQLKLEVFDKDQNDSREQITYKGVTYTRQDCIEDINSLYDDYPERRITRDFYREHANIPEAVWLRFFGTFQEFLKQADIRFTRYQSKINTTIAKHASQDPIRAISDEIKNYGNLYLREKGNRFKTIVATSDWHDIECDPFYFRVLKETVKTIDPDVVCLAGDIFDCAEMGKYHVDPREWNIVENLTTGLDMIGEIRSVAPDAQIDFIAGNHESRLLKHFNECSPLLKTLLSDYHKMDVRKLYRLDEYEVNYISNGDLHTFTDAQLRREVAKNYKVYWNSVVAHHFPEGRNLGLPGFNGHHHKYMVWSEYSIRSGSYQWHQMGCGHKREASYCDGSKWNNGFLIVNIDTQYGYVNFDYVDVGATVAIAGGTWYYRKENEMYPALVSEMQTMKG